MAHVLNTGRHHNIVHARRNEHRAEVDCLLHNRTDDRSSVAV